jgi:hypothetical protein
MRIGRWAAVTIGIGIGIGIGIASGAGAAGGDDAGPGVGAGAEASPVADVRLKCRTFPTEIGAEIDTRDGSSSLGQWVISLEDRGWEVASVDLAVGQKPTGFPQGYAIVCLQPLR